MKLQDYLSRERIRATVQDMVEEFEETGDPLGSAINGLLYRSALHEVQEDNLNSDIMRLQGRAHKVLTSMANHLEQQDQRVTAVASALEQAFILGNFPFLFKKE